jgi:hypothetical protein
LTKNIAHTVDMEKVQSGEAILGKTKRDLEREEINFLMQFLNSLETKIN